MAKQPPKVPPTPQPAPVPEPEPEPQQEPWFALPLADLQAIEHHLKREMIAGQEAAGLLQKLIAAQPATMIEE